LLASYVEKRYNQLGGGSGSGIGVMRLASGASPQRYRQIQSEGRKAILGNAMNTPDLYSAGVWGELDLGEGFRQPIHSRVRTLFISGSLDSNTPPANAEAVRKGFSKASHVLVQYAGHESLLPDEAVQQLINRFFKQEGVDSQTLLMAKPVFKAIVSTPGSPK
jgi:pimeloyl-ACP methyl ester carboxylesterase